MIINRDLIQAVAWWKKGADKYHHGAEAALGEARLVGSDGTRAQPDVALKLLKRAAAGRVPRAMFIPDQEAGAEWIAEATAAGFSERKVLADALQFEKSLLLDSSTEVMDNITTTLSSTNSAAFAQFTPQHQVNIQTLELSMGLLRRAAMDGVPKAMYVLGLCLKKGFGTRKDEREARYWLDKADSAGWVTWDDSIDPETRWNQMTDEEKEDKQREEAIILQISSHRKVTSKVSPELIAAAEAKALAVTGGSILGRQKQAKNNNDVIIANNAAVTPELINLTDNKIIKKSRSRSSSPTRIRIIPTITTNPISDESDECSPISQKSSLSPIAPESLAKLGATINNDPSIPAAMSSLDSPVKSFSNTETVEESGADEARIVHIDSGIEKLEKPGQHDYLTDNTMSFSYPYPLNYEPPVDSLVEIVGQSNLLDSDD